MAVVGTTTRISNSALVGLFKSQVRANLGMIASSVMPRPLTARRVRFKWETFNNSNKCSIRWCSSSHSSSRRFFKLQLRIIRFFASKKLSDHNFSACQVQACTMAAYVLVHIITMKNLPVSTSTRVQKQQCV